MVHGEIDSVAIRENRVQDVPFERDVMHQLRLYVEMRHEVLRPVSNINSVMAIRAVRCRSSRAIATGSETDTVESTKIRVIHTNREIRVFYCYVADPALGHVFQRERVVARFFEVARIGRPRKLY